MSEWIDILKEYVLSGKILDNKNAYESWIGELYPDNCTVDKMNNHPDLDSMSKYIHESIKHECERHIMLNRISLGLPPYPIDNMRGFSKPIILAAPPIDEMAKSNVIPYINLESSIIDENKIKGFKAGVIFDWKKDFLENAVRTITLFPRAHHERGWFCLERLMMERYYAEQRMLSLANMSKYNKSLNLDDVIWCNRPMILYAVKVIKDEKWDEVSYDSIPYLDVIVRKMILDIDPWKDALRHFGRNYTEGLKISKWNVSYVTKEMCPNMSDDEIKYINHMWNELSGDKPYTSDFNNNKPKNSWLERKTKRGKLR